MGPNARAVALSSLDVPDGPGLLVYSCEDCACPVSQQSVPRRRSAEPPDGELVCARDAAELPLDNEHRALFGPHGNGGVVVVNKAALEIFHGFRQPRSVSDLGPVGYGHGEAATASVVGRLVEHDLVHPVDAIPAPSFAPSSQLTAWLHVTNACNLRCHYCYVHKSNEHMDGDLGLAAVDALVRSAVGNGFRALRLKYAGGEASLNPTTLLELHDHAVARCAAAGLSLSAVLLSNGVAIPAAFATELRARGIKVMISLDGLGAANDAQRPTVAGRPSSPMVIRTIELLRGLGLAPHLSITITGRNVTAVAPVVRFALERGLTFS